MKATTRHNLLGLSILALFLLASSLDYYWSQEDAQPYTCDTDTDCVLKCLDATKGDPQCYEVLGVRKNATP